MKDVSNSSASRAPTYFGTIPASRTSLRTLLTTKISPSKPYFLRRDKWLYVFNEGPPAMINAGLFDALYYHM